MSATDPHVAQLDVAAQLAADSGDGAVWNHTSTDLNVNLVRWDAGNGVTTHVNHEVDVVIVVLAGEGVIEVDGDVRTVQAGHVSVIPKGVARSLRSTGEMFAYLTCHRRRGGLMPA